MIAAPDDPPRRRWRALLLMAGLMAGLMAAGLSASDAAAQGRPARVDVYVQADSVKVGEPFRLSLVAEHNFSTEVRFPTADAGPLVFGDLEVLERSDVSERFLGADGPGQRLDSVSYRVATFALDSARVPAIPVEVIVGSDTVLVSSQPEMVPVIATVGPDAQKLKGLAPLAAFPQPLWPYALLAIAALAALAGLFYWWRRDDAPPPDPDPAPASAEPPADVARRRLDRLQPPSTNDPEAIEAYYVELSSTLRTYLADRLGVAALERTTSELVDALTTRSDVPEPSRVRVRAVLEIADLVKFADTRPSPSDHETALREARAAIQAIEDARPASPSAAPAPAEAEGSVVDDA